MKTVMDMSQKANLPMPKVYTIPSPSPNAFATGRDPQHAAVAATEGLLRMLSETELEGVIAHELAHVKHRDILISTVAVVIPATIFFVSASVSGSLPPGERMYAASWILATVAGAMFWVLVARSTIGGLALNSAVPSFMLALILMYLANEFFGTRIGGLEAFGIVGFLTAERKRLDPRNLIASLDAVMTGQGESAPPESRA